MKEIVITNKNGITLPTKKSLVDDDIKIKLDNSIKAIDGISEKNGIITILDQSKPIEISRSSSDITITNSGKKTNIKIGSYSMVSLLDTSESNVIEAENLTPENIKKDVNILGTIGTFEGGSDTNQEDGLIEGTLTSYTNDRVTSIRKYAFYYTNIETLNLSNVINVSGDSIRKNDKLESIYLSSATSLEYQAIYDNNNLKNVYIPNVTSIGGFALYSNPLLKKIVIEQKDKICYLSGTYVFNGCYHILGEVDSKYNPNGDKDGYIYVPASRLAEYKVETNWATYETQLIGHQDFNVGDTLPSYANDTYTTCTWYNDETLTTVVTEVSTAGRYYCRLEA